MPIRNLNASQKTKHTPAGEIPVEWESVRLRTVGDISYGLTVNQIRREQAKRLPCVTVSDFCQGRMSAEKAKLVGCLPGDTEKYALEPEDVLVVEGNGNPDIVGRATRWLQSEEGAVLHQNHLLRIRLDRKRILPSLLVDWLNSEGCRRHLRPRIITSSGLNTLNSKSLGGCFVPLPPLPEQRRIAEILTTWDRAIEQTEKLIEAKKRLKKGLMQQLLTGKLRFPQFREQETVLDEFPAGWQTLKAGELFVRSTERGSPDDPVLSVMQEGGVVRRDSIDRKITATEGSTSTYKRVLPGDFVISLRSFQGGLEYSPLGGKVSPAYHVIRARKAIVDDFYRHFFKSYWFVGHLATAVIGIRDGKQVSFGDFEFLRLPYPPLEEQDQIAKALGAADANVQALTMQLEALKRQKKGLMQKLLTGAIRVRDLH